MTTHGVPRGFTSRLALALIVCLGLLLLAAPVGAQSIDAPAASPVPEETGGIVPSTQEADPIGDPESGDGDVPETEPGHGENEGALAPGFVTVVVWTSDGSPLPSDASVCVGAECRPVGGSPTGAKIEFDDVPSGWQAVNVYKSAPYLDYAGSVQVLEGAGSRVDVTLREALEQRPRQPLEEIPVRGQSGRDVVVSEQAPFQGAAQGDLELSVVRRLPATGSGESDAVSAWWAVSGTVAVAAAGIGARLRWGHRPY